MPTLPSTPLFDGTSSHNSNLLLQSTPIFSTLKSITANQKFSILPPTFNEFSSVSQSNTVNFTNNHLTTNSSIINNNKHFEPESIGSTNYSPKKIHSPKIKEMFKYKVNQFRKIKVSCNIIILMIFISSVSITVSTLRIDSFVENLPKSEERVSSNQRHQFEYGFWKMAFLTTLFHLMVSTTLLIICLIHLYCAYSITKNLEYSDDEVFIYLNSTGVWRNIMAYFYLVSLMISIITNTCFIFVIPTNIALHTFFKWCKIVKDENYYNDEYNSPTCPRITRTSEKMDINSLSTLLFVILSFIDLIFFPTTKKVFRKF
ncbi:Hypothetical protein SRAE_2000113600 [Strongyloides ratti]|uniref:Uncharacterized protein n=1 Tax=Strongyloides ratti TaxID=34506 RepID=A0A090LE95_STRRB|nr:Hypothetical protein SRAE_2000113600 [Strongyloides ratti]CEF66468.1 Hypothetical protein SRAE_2000113600 [Strongyloides ratti]